MHHSFDISIAEKFGVNVAIFLNNVAFWVKKNQANNRHFYDGRYWTYNSSDALSSLFPYWSSDQIDRLVKKCTSLGLVVIDNFNEKTYDRTRWYGLTDKGLELFNMTLPRNRGMDSAKSPNPSREIAEPIPDIKPDIKPNKREQPRKKPRVPLPHDYQPSPLMLAKAKQVEIETGTLVDKLISKFKIIQARKEATSSDWDREFELFLLNEKPAYKISTPERRINPNETRSTVPFFEPTISTGTKPTPEKVKNYVQDALQLIKSKGMGLNNATRQMENRART